MKYGQVSIGICRVCGDHTRKQATFDTEEERDAWVPDFRHVFCKIREEQPVEARPKRRRTR